MCEEAALKGLVLGSQESRCYYRCAGEGLCLAYSIFLSMYSLSCSVATPILVPAGSINIRPGLRTVRPSKSGLHCKDTVVELPASKRFSVWRRRVCAHTQTHPTFSCGKELGAGGAVSVYFHVYATTSEFLPCHSYATSNAIIAVLRSSLGARFLHVTRLP